MIHIKKSVQNITEYITIFFLMILNMLMVIFPKEIVSSAKNGLMLWFNYALPSLLPFIIVSKMLSLAGFAQIARKPMTPITRLLFNMDGSSVLPIISGFVSGCPVGAKTTCDLYKDGFISKSDAQRLLCFTNNSGPLFILGTVASGMLSDVKSGYAIMSVHYTASVITGAALRFYGKAEEPVRTNPPVSYKKNGSILGNAVYDGMESILLIGGYIILFSVIIGLFDKLPLPFDKNTTNTFFAAVTEVTKGCMLLSKSRHGITLCAAAISWGGISIHAQTYGFVKSAGLKMYPYILSRLFQSVLAAALMPIACILYHI